MSINRLGPLGWRGFIYSVMMYSLLTPLLLRLWLRGRQHPGYRHHWRQRLGFQLDNYPTHAIWVHAVSVGETEAAAPLLRRLIDRGESLLVTTTTPTGADRLRQLFGDRIHHCYLPFDTPFTVKRFLQQLKPRLAIIMETELWPNLLVACSTAQIPLLLANGRLSQRSADRYRRFHGLTSALLAQIDILAVQSCADGERFINLGVPASRVRVTGNLKFDRQPPPDIVTAGKQLRHQLGAMRPIWIAASSREGEETRLLDALSIVRQHYPDLLMILAPRHPQRADAIAHLCQQRGLRIARRSRGDNCSPSCDLLLGDQLGELLLLYAAADIAFVGGSLLPFGGHNPLEPAALGIPIVMGPFRFNFNEISLKLEQAGALRSVHDAATLAAVLIEMMADPEQRQQMASAGRRVVMEGQGATERLLGLIAQLDPK